MQKDLDRNAYFYHLPEENIAQHPVDKRDHSKLLVLNRSNNTTEHRQFKNIKEYLSPGDLLIVNNTEVFPARLEGHKDSGGKVEVFLLELPVLDGEKTSYATALLKASRHPQKNSHIHINENLSCEVVKLFDGGKARLKLITEKKNIHEVLSEAGDVPLPPYIKRTGTNSQEDKERYQTVYADVPGAVAAPTAGLHFTKELLSELSQQGVQLGQITLHVGYGTFAPVREDNIENHQIHHEYVSVSEETARQIMRTKEAGKKVWAVGTTTVRALEFAARENQGTIAAIEGWCDLYIYPGFTFKVIDNLITNFHLPNSSLMFLVSALCGRETLLTAYEMAIRENYRFFSYGDAMAIIV